LKNIPRNYESEASQPTKNFQKKFPSRRARFPSRASTIVTDFSKEFEKNLCGKLKSMKLQSIFPFVRGGGGDRGEVCYISSN